MLLCKGGRRSGVYSARIGGVCGVGLRRHEIIFSARHSPDIRSGF
jgi:hypothetical protein